MSANDFRVERDSMGELRVPADALWGAQTQRAVQNFPLSGLVMPRGFIRALGLVKWAAAGANIELGELDKVRGFATQRAALEVAEGRQPLFDHAGEDGLAVALRRHGHQLGGEGEEIR